MTTKSVLALALAAFTLGNQAAAQVKRQAAEHPAKAPVKEKAARSELENLISRLMKDGAVPGLSIALIKDAEILWQHGFGVKNSETKEPVDDTTVFEAASLTKPVFAYAVLKMVDRGEIDLDTPLSKYLPGPYIENDERVNLITTRMVLSHTTGFPNWRGPNRLQINFAPGSKFSYSGEGFVYLQKVVERLTSMPLDQYLKKNVFEPLGMASSSLVWLDQYETLKATGHNVAAVPGIRRKPTQANAAASLHTTAGDYARFVIAILGGTGLKKETLRQMMTAQIKVSEVTGQPSPTIAWGLGWGLQQTEAGQSFWHWGDNGDVHCYIAAFEKEKSGIVIFTDSANGLSIIPEIAQKATGLAHPAHSYLRYEPYNSPARALFKSILADGVDAALKRYLAGREKLAKAETLAETQMNRLGYWLLQGKRTKEAIEVFKQNVADYPESSNVYDSLGEAYMVNGDRELAIKNYKRALELDPKNSNAVQMLKKLETQ
jgi:CubicO group peptidase (beta-lactamase class C family)